jgi:tetratricopeptide (TPR) repeat protein
MSWTKNELKSLKASGKEISIIHPGFIGKLETIRENDNFLEFKLCPQGGMAYILPSSIITPPIGRFDVGARVKCLYGAGIIRQMRIHNEFDQDGYIDYVVEFVDKQLANNTPVIGYINSKDLSIREQRLFVECLKESSALRESGNNLFKAKLYDLAVLEYQKAMEVLVSFSTDIPLSSSERNELKHACVKCLSNTAASLLACTPPDLKSVIRNCTEAISIDPHDQVKQHEKLLFRRGIAYSSLGMFDEAIQDFTSPCLKNDVNAQRKAEEARIAKEKSLSKEKNFWGKALSSNSVGSGIKAPSSPSTPSSKSNDQGTSDSPTNALKTMNGGHTPYPKSSSNDWKDEIEDEYDESGNASSSLKKDAADASATMTLEKEETSDEQSNSILGTVAMSALAVSAIAVVGLGAYMFMRRNR